MGFFGALKKDFELLCTLLICELHLVFPTHHKFHYILFSSLNIGSLVILHFIVRKIKCV